MHKYYSEIIIPKPINEVFDFFDKPQNLKKLMPNFMRFNLLTPEPITMKEGAIFDYIVTVFGINQRWTSYISDYNPPYSFTDIQLKGPNSYWNHIHVFEEVKDGTKVIDKVCYLLPMGPFGRVANKIIMIPIIKKLFQHRKNIITKQFKLKSHDI